MSENLPNKILIIGNIKKDNSMLLRKKKAGSRPYAGTWYFFGCEFVPGESPEETFMKYIKEYLGITISPVKHLFWDTEIKADHDGIKKQFIYLEIEADYVSGEIRVPDELEKVEFVAIGDLFQIDLVPPAKKMFKRLGYLQ